MEESQVDKMLAAWASEGAAIKVSFMHVEAGILPAVVVGRIRRGKSPRTWWFVAPGRASGRRLSLSRRGELVTGQIELPSAFENVELGEAPDVVAVDWEGCVWMFERLGEGLERTLRDEPEGVFGPTFQEEFEEFKAETEDHRLEE